MDRLIVLNHPFCMTDSEASRDREKDVIKLNSGRASYNVTLGEDEDRVERRIKRV